MQGDLEHHPEAQPVCFFHVLLVKEHKPPEHDLGALRDSGLHRALAPCVPVTATATLLGKPKAPISSPVPSLLSLFSLPGRLLDMLLLIIQDSTWNVSEKFFPECSGAAFRKRSTWQYSPLPPITSLPVTPHHSLCSAHCFLKLAICSPTYFLHPPQVHSTNIAPGPCSPLRS